MCEFHLFLLGEDFYVQDEGLAIVSPLSPILTDLFMDDLEQKGLSTCSNGYRVPWRYVDNVLLFWNMNSGDIESFHKHMDSLNPAEIEKYDKIPFFT
jgi:hypothetical protein